MSAQDQLVLAIETTAPKCGAALARASTLDRRVVAEHYSAGGTGRAESLAECVRAVLAAGNCNAAALTGIAVVDGPGSYTGLRVGLALARGLALVDGLRLAPVGSLELIARMVDDQPRLCAVMDAGQGKIYAAGYSRDGSAVQETHSVAVVAAGELHAHLKGWPGLWTICGDAELARAIPLDVVAPPARAGALALAGIELLARDGGRVAETVLPRYAGAVGARPNPVAVPAAVLTR